MLAGLDVETATTPLPMAREERSGGLQQGARRQLGQAEQFEVSCRRFPWGQACAMAAMTAAAAAALAERIVAIPRQEAWPAASGPR